MIIINYKSILSKCSILLGIFFLLSCTNLRSRGGRLEFVKEYRTELNYVAHALLDHGWTEEQAQDYLNKEGIYLKVDGVNVEKRMVGFEMDRIFNNCIGIAYSEGYKMEYLGRMRTVKWELLLGNWHLIDSQKSSSL